MNRKSLDNCWFLVIYCDIFFGWRFSNIIFCCVLMLHTLNIYLVLNKKVFWRCPFGLSQDVICIFLHFLTIYTQKQSFPTYGSRPSHGCKSEGWHDNSYEHISFSQSCVNVFWSILLKFASGNKRNPLLPRFHSRHFDLSRWTGSRVLIMCMTYCDT